MFLKYNLMLKILMKYLPAQMQVPVSILNIMVVQKMGYNQSVNMDLKSNLMPKIQMKYLPAKMYLLLIYLKYLSLLKHITPKVNISMNYEVLLHKNLHKILTLTSKMKKFLQIILELKMMSIPPNFDDVLLLLN